MPARPPLSDRDAAERARAWLASRHRWNRDLVVVLLRHAPRPTSPAPLTGCRPASWGGWPGCWPRPPTCTRSPAASSLTSSSTSTPTPAVAPGGRDEAAPARFSRLFGGVAVRRTSQG